MSLDPSDPHDLRSTEEAAIETAHLAVEKDAVEKAVETLRQVEGVQDVHGEAATGTVSVTFDARKTHVPALHDALLRGGYKPSAT